MRDFKIVSIHKGEDYYSFTIQDKYVEVSFTEGKTVMFLIKLIKSIINDSSGHNEIIK